MSSALPKLQVTPPFSACDVSRGALAATQGSGSRLCQKKMMVFGAGVLAQTHLEQYCFSCFRNHNALHLVVMSGTCGL